MEKANCDAVYVLADPLRPKIPELAAARRIPAVYQYSLYVEIGGLVSYGPDLTWVFRRAADYVDRIFKGAKPAELPVEQPTKFELVLNLKTARSLGLSVPESTIAFCDRVIE